MDLGKRLRAERRRLGYSQSGFAEAVGVSKNSQLNYEIGSRHADTAYLTRAAEVGMDIHYVLSGIPTPHEYLTLDPLDTELIIGVQKLSAYDQALVRDLIRSLARKG